MSKKELNAILKRISDEQDKRLNPEEHEKTEVLPYELGHQAPVILENAGTRSSL